MLTVGLPAVGFAYLIRMYFGRPHWVFTGLISLLIWGCSFAFLVNFTGAETPVSMSFSGGVAAALILSLPARRIPGINRINGANQNVNPNESGAATKSWLKWMIAGALLVATWYLLPFDLLNGLSEAELGDASSSPARTRAHAESGPKPPIEVKWKKKVSDLGLNSLVVNDSTLYFSTTEKRVHAINAETGQELWDSKTLQDAYSLTVGKKAAYVGEFSGMDSEGHVYAMDKETGRVRWRFETVGSVFGAPAVDGGNVYIGSIGGSSEVGIDGFVRSLDVETGKEKWHFSTPVSSSPVAFGGSIYVGSGDDHVYALAAETGRQKWKFETGGAVGSPTVTEEAVYVASDDDLVYALDSETGREKWRFKTDHGASTPVVAGGNVYIVGGYDSTATNDYVHSLNAESGQKVWTFRLEGSYHMFSPVVAGNTIYVGRSNGYVYALSTESGKQKWRYQIDGEIVIPPIVSDGTLYVGIGPHDFDPHYHIQALE